MSDQNAPIPAEQGNIYAPPSARVDDVVPEGELVLAERITRLGAVIIDGIIVGGLFWGIAAVFGFSMFSLGTEPSLAHMATIFVGSVAIYLAINGYLLEKYGQSVGKKLLKIKIVRTDGSKIGLGRIIGLRWLPVGIAGYVPLVGPIFSLVNALLIFRETRKCLHDNIADTIVIRI